MRVRKRFLEPLVLICYSLNCIEVNSEKQEKHLNRWLNKSNAANTHEHAQKKAKLALHEFWSSKLY